MIHRFRIGQTVREHDGRHIGEIIAIRSSVFITVRWRDSGWLSTLDYRDLEACFDD